MTFTLERDLLGIDDCVPDDDVMSVIVPSVDNPMMAYRRFLIGSQAIAPNIIGGSLLVGIIFFKKIVIDDKTGKLTVMTDSFFVGQEWCTGGSYLDVKDVDL